ncbi:amino acid ABC transporter ATP-binding protein (PAAT family) [Prosthecobacter fusiformis]|uniref:Amino acid ABC transporter ATP-binding protein (PAAT family) n=1 Tax=Prosthecobacter fusiformis TaxID=48464 RepID=A0A4R7RLE0_9BACT|nr:amino acid ABC transporter ATP-binding protein [Prosthecobacter fusiformis]TDU62518.1 amino acid ABC transporter ATP-binding protein (PAAT family) [Prosthecobacter fusiformis]
MKLETRSVVKRYGAFHALDKASFQTGDDARVVVLLGPSGGGKSTMLRVLGGLLVPEEGSVLVDEEELPHEAEGALRVLRQNGFVFQGYNLFPHLTALQNVTLPLTAVHGQTETAARQRAVELLTRLGLAEHMRKRPAELSGGQQQRAAIARALASKPRLLLLDEPTSALDPVMTGEVLDVIRELVQEGQQIVLATHELSFARQIADWVVFLAKGSVFESCPAVKFFDDPTSSFAKDYLTAVTKYR